eukprot:TRINITY_DN4701_c0_g1_i1.p1 TRINITY_DN4701_c0_g1~~TRINITY_DN4701_c0_g1_i1.p1  ORF type:complete len:521 (-),score=129.82 TRINITY_DN4701_c0_g1_i1:32-1549(-)
MNILLVIVGIVAVGSIWMYTAIRRLGDEGNSRFKEGKDIPGPPRNWLLGNIKQMDPNCTHVKFHNMIEQYGKVCRFWAGPLFKFVVVSDPKFVEQVLVHQRDNYTNSDQFREAMGSISPNGLIVIEGEHWAKLRRLTQAALQISKLRQMPPLVEKCCQDMFAEWEKTASTNDHVIDVQKSSTSQKQIVIDSKDWFDKLLFDAFGEFGYGYNFNTIQGKNLDISDATKALWTAIKFRTVLPFKFLYQLPTPANKKFAAAKKRVQEFTKELIEMKKERVKRENITEPEDLLTALLLAAEKGESLTEEEVLDNIILFYFGSFETTSNTLAFTLDFIATNPDVQQRIIDEMNAQGGKLDYFNMPYLDNVIKESMRLRPTSLAIPRTALVDHIVEGWKVPKGAIITMNIFEMGRDPALWGCSTREEVERFDPDRWNNAENAEIRRYTYLPFGAGSRMCVGMKLANLEMKVVLTEILRRYVVVADSKRPLELYTDSTLQPRDAWVILTPRK